MCGICGCDDHGSAATAQHRHSPTAGRSPALERLLHVEQAILGKNDGFAAENRERLAELGVLALNLVSSPGAGKTSLLVGTIARLRGKAPIAVIEGDQETERDADRIRAAGVPAVQINTGRGCHLDAHMVGHALDELRLEPGSIVFIENVGNLVCPAAFDLGEAHKVAILSVAEGDDKPLKYPDMFAAARLLVIGKTDLLPHVEFAPDRAIEYARRINPGIEAMQLSVRTGDGLDGWCDWICAERAAVLAARSASLGNKGKAIRRRAHVHRDHPTEAGSGVPEDR